MCEQQQFLKILLLSLQAGLNCSQLTIIPNSFFLESFDYSLIRLLNTLCLIVLDHNFIQAIFQNSNISHQRTFLNVSEFIAFYLFELILQGEQIVLFLFGLVFFLVKHTAQIVFVHVGSDLPVEALPCKVEAITVGWVVGCTGELVARFLRWDELVSDVLQFLVLLLEFFDLLLVLFFYLLGLS